MILVLVFSTSLFTRADEPDKKELESCQRFIEINGTSNVNSFSLISNTLYLTNPDSKNKSFSRKVLVPVAEFHGERKQLIYDFQKMIRAGQNPFIYISVNSELPEGELLTGKTILDADITVAGKTRSYKIPCEISPCQSSSWSVEGNLEIKLTDFGIEPPEKVFGMIRVDNEVFINFAFVFHSELLTEKTKN